MKRDGLGAGRLLRKPPPVRCFERFGAPMVSATSCFTSFVRNMTLSVPLCFEVFVSENLLCVDWFALQTPSVAVFAEGSSDQEPDSPRKSMARGCDERPRPDHHGSITRKHCNLQCFL